LSCPRAGTGAEPGRTLRPSASTGALCNRRGANRGQCGRQPQVPGSAADDRPTSNGECRRIRPVLFDLRREAHGANGPPARVVDARLYFPIELHDAIRESSRRSQRLYLDSMSRIGRVAGQYALARLYCGHFALLAQARDQFETEWVTRRFDVRARSRRSRLDPVPTAAACWKCIRDEARSRAIRTYDHWVSESTGLAARSASSYSGLRATTITKNQERRSRP
jgi:hypothetical protein